MVSAPQAWLGLIVSVAGVYSRRLAVVSRVTPPLVPPSRGLVSFSRTASNSAKVHVARAQTSLSAKSVADVARGRTLIPALTLQATKESQVVSAEYDNQERPRNQVGAQRMHKPWAFSGVGATLTAPRDGDHAGNSAEVLSEHQPSSHVGNVGGLLAASLAAFCVAVFALAMGLTAWPGAALAGDKRIVAEIPASGFLFKDTINVEEFDDPKVKGVSLYISDFSRSMADRVSKGDFFSDPGAAGLTCVKTGPVLVAPDLQPRKEGEDVFTEGRSLLFKTLKVKRVYDAESKNIVYVVFTERMDTSDDKNKSRFKSQICAVHVDGVQGQK